MTRRVAFRIEAWAAKRPFRISGFEWRHFAGVVCEIEEQGCIGRGEAIGVYYLDETEFTLLEQLEDFKPELQQGLDRAALQERLPPGGARNAIDCALWDLEAQLSGRSAWAMAGVEPAPVHTLLTFGLDTSVTEQAQRARDKGLNLLKVKLDANEPVELIRRVRAACPEASIVVDVNGGWTAAELERYAPQLKTERVALIEQPLPRGEDAVLDDYQSPLPLCADESCLHLGELEDIVGRYQLLNIKLDKTGGLTHGLQLADAARARGVGVMVGNMCGSSLSMAPLHVLAQKADWVDLDGPLMARSDYLDGLVYRGNEVSLPDQRFWGR